MKYWKGIFGSMAMVLSVTFGCQDVGNEPPIVEVVSPYDIPYPFSPETYGKFGFLGETKNILEQLRLEGIAVRDAWEPSGDGVCMMPEIRILVIRLREPDNRIIEEFGFSRDSERSRFTCSRTWKHYRY